MALFLSYKELWDRPLSGRSREKEIPHWAGNIIFGVLFVICKLCFRYTVSGRENLRGFYRKQGVVVIGNHTSYLDVVFLYLSARTKQWIRPMGRDDLFDNAGGLAGQIISRVGAFPVKRESADLSAIKRAARMLKNAEIVGVFPEGTRRGKGTMASELHSGAAFIARMGKAPLLPVTVRNAEYIKQKGKRIRFPKVSVEYGQPISLPDFDFLPKEERLDACTWYAMRECFALSLLCKPEEVDMVELFPNAKDYRQIFLDHPIPKHTTEELCSPEGAAKGASEEPQAAQETV
ncbi:MAG: 1-acyl-sn-glycerol-3-phosphate acyltransferase [Eggerthellaceae bacterium]|nr:1-acyl-sn-glycerol-3-phosphate acyltransferase [Eggerthellaceae bacterium]